VTHPAPIGAPAFDTGNQRGVLRIAGAGVDEDGGQVTEIFRIGQPLHLRGDVPAARATRR